MVSWPRSPAKLSRAISSTLFCPVSVLVLGMSIASTSTDRLVEPRSTLSMISRSMPPSPRMPKMLVGLANTKSYGFSPAWAAWPSRRDNLSMPLPSLLRLIWLAPSPKSSTRADN